MYRYSFISFFGGRALSFNEIGATHRVGVTIIGFLRHSTHTRLVAPWQFNLQGLCQSKISFCPPYVVINSFLAVARVAAEPPELQCSWLFIVAPNIFPCEQ